MSGLHLATFRARMWGCAPPAGRVPGIIRRACLVLVALMAPVARAGGPGEGTGFEPMACGPAALIRAARLLGREVSGAEMRAAIGGRLTGTHSLSTVVSAARRLGFRCWPIRLDPLRPTLARLPLLVPVSSRAGGAIGPDHFLLLYGRINQKIQILDGTEPPRLAAIADFARQWNGDGVYLALRDAELGAVREDSDRSWLCILIAAAAVVGGARMYCLPPIRREA